MAETFTYGNDPAGSARDRVRIDIGDATSNKEVALLSDQVIDFRLSQEITEARAAWRCVEDIVASLARDTNWTTGGQSQSKDQRYEHYVELEKKLRRRANGRYVAFTAGGQSLSEKQTQRSDTDRTQNTFHSDMHRNPLRDSAGQS